MTDIDGTKGSTPVDVETGDRVSNKPSYSSTTPASNTGNKWLSVKWLTLSAVTIAALVCVITVPIVVKNKNNNNNSNANLVQNSNNGGTSSGSTNTPSNGSSNNGSTNTTVTQSYYERVNGPFNSSIELLNSNVTAGYASADELKASIANAANYYLGLAFAQNLQIGTANANVTTTTTPTTSGADNNMEMAPTTDLVNSVSNDASNQKGADGGSASGSSSFSDFGTNNQEKGVEEGDVIVSDGTYVYAAYGKYVVVWDAAKGTMVEAIEMPPVNSTCDNVAMPYATGVSVDATDSASASEGNASSSSKMIADTSAPFLPYWCWPSEPYVQSLLLNQNRLLVIVGGYGDEHKTKSATGDIVNVLDGYLSTNVRIYETPSMKFLGATDLNGYYSGVRQSADGLQHIITTSGVNTWYYLQNPMNIYNYGNATTTEYAQTITVLSPDLSKNFTEQLMKDLSAGGKPMPDLVRINLFQTTASPTGLEDTIYSSGIMNTLALVHSLDMMSTDLNSTLATTTSSGAFMPSYWAQVYGSETMIILAGDVYEYDNVVGSSKQSTALIAFEIVSGSGTKPNSIGTVPGTIINSYALDAVGNTLRIATTVRNDTWIYPMLLEDTSGSDAAASSDNSTITIDPTTGSSNTSTSSDNATIAIEPPMQFVWTPPDTENYIIVLQMPGQDSSANPGLMTELGRVQLGKPKESFTAVQFTDTTAYAVTFLQTDPFYVVDLSNPSNLVVSAELQISGFSSYMYFINSTALLAVGQDALDNGTITGLQITFFDVSVPTNPVAKSRYNIVTSQNAYSWSDALWDFKSFRYTNGYFFMPVDIDDYSTVDSPNSFHGTMVFTVDSNGDIAEKTSCRVNHTVPYYGSIMIDTPINSVSTTKQGTASNVTMQPCNYTGGYLPRRTMVFNGDLMSTYNSEIILMDLDTCQEQWKQTIAIPVPGGCQVYNY